MTLESCTDFLTLDPPPSKIGIDDVFESNVTATSAILGIYSYLLDGRTFASGDATSMSSLAGLSGDELTNYARYDKYSLELESNTIRPDNLHILSLWSSMYKVIYSSNLYKERLEASVKIDNDVKSQLLGEVLFIRAFCNFYLVNLFGDVPLVLTSDYSSNARASRTDSDRVYDQIMSDLIAARELLSDDYVARSAERIRPNRSAATALLARVYLFRNDWANAEAMATEVIDKTDFYELVDDLDAVFLKNSREAIWQLMPSTVDGTGATEEGEIFWPNNALNYNILRESSVDMFSPNDLRLTYWVTNLVLDPDTLYFPAKYKQWDSSAPLTEYSMVLRLAELYLIRAEARAKQDELVGENSASEDLNRIRKRAGLQDSDAVDANGILEAIARERRAELFTEWGHRWFDLKRTGHVVDALSGLKPGISTNDALYPIPESEFSKNSNLGLQNDGY